MHLAHFLAEPLEGDAAPIHLFAAASQLPALPIEFVAHSMLVGRHLLFVTPATLLEFPPVLLKRRVELLGLVLQFFPP